MGLLRKQTVVGADLRAAPIANKVVLSSRLRGRVSEIRAYYDYHYPSNSSRRFHGRHGFIFFRTRKARKARNYFFFRPRINRIARIGGRASPLDNTKRDLANRSRRASPRRAPLSTFLCHECFEYSRYLLRGASRRSAPTTICQTFLASVTSVEDLYLFVVGSKNWLCQIAELFSSFNLFESEGV